MDTRPYPWAGRLIAALALDALDKLLNARDLSEAPGYQQAKDLLSSYQGRSILEELRGSRVDAGTAASL